MDTWISGAARRALHRLAGCEGPGVAEGFVAALKQNDPENAVLTGWRRIRRCRTCGALYSRDDRGDLLDPSVRFRNDKLEAENLAKGTKQK